MTETYVTAHYFNEIEWEEKDIETGEIMKGVGDIDLLGFYDPVSDEVVLSAAALNLEATYDNDYSFRGEMEAEQIRRGAYGNYSLTWLYSWFLKLFIITTNHELLHAIMREFDFTEKQEEWIIEKMGWT